MERKIRLVTDCTASLTKKECEDRNIVCLELSYMLDGEEHLAFDDEETSLPEFYKKLDTVKKCSTSCVNTEAFETCFDDLVKNGYDVIYIGLSSAFSSTYGNAKIAADTVNERYGTDSVTVIDSRVGSYGIVLYIDKIEELIAEGKNRKQIKEIIEKDIENSFGAFVPADISFIHKCGRLTTLEAYIGKILKIVPIISPDKVDGKLKTTDKCIGMKRALEKLKSKFIEYFKSHNHTRCYISSCDMQKEVESLKNFVVENTGLKPEDIKVGLIDKTMSCCCGPRTISIYSI